MVRAAAHGDHAQKKLIGYQERKAAERAAYLTERARHAHAGRTFVHVDEGGFAPSTARRHAYAPKGQRVHGLIAGKKRPRTSLIAARVGERFAAPFLIEGTCNGHVFNAWFELCLCPRLDARHVVVMDNASFHKSERTRELIEATGAVLLFLPPYSPDLNPIEHDFAALKKRREFDADASLEQIVKAYM